MGLLKGDLNNLVHHVFEIDEYKSKMGEDADIITLSFVVHDKEPADDFVKFVEAGYEFVLDADATAGEQDDGKYRVFIEIERNRDAIDCILNIVDGVGKLANLDDIRFRYRKNFRSHPATREELEGEVPTDPDAYDLRVTESVIDNYKDFFSRSFVEEVKLDDELLTIKKMYAEAVYFKVLDFGDSTDIRESITETINFNDWAEIIYLTKYIGDYNITKYGKKITIENKEKTLVLERL